MAHDFPWTRSPMTVMLIFVVAVQILSIALMPYLAQGDARVFQNPQSAANPIIYILMVIGFTALLLIAIKWRKGSAVSAFIQISIALSIFYILLPLLGLIPGLLLTVAAVLLIRYYPEWYVIDALGILICAGISTLFGISMTTMPALILLVILAVYDAISVYKTKHMVSLAEGVITLKAPLLFIVPRARGYSFRKEQTATSEGRGAYFLGLGDAIIPTILVISAQYSLPAPSVFGVAIPAIGAMLGTYIGFFALLQTSREKPQAGLPFLNGGAVLGFLAACLLVGVPPF